MERHFQELYNQAEDCIRGDGVPIDYNKALELCREGLTSNEPHFINMLGYFYETGNGIVQDREKAFELFVEAAEKGFPRAQFNVGLRLLQQDNFEGAMAWLKKAELQGDECAITKIGVVYEYGFGFPVDDDKAFQYYQRAAQLGDFEAVGRLYICYRDGRGISKNFKERDRLLQIGVDSEDPFALYEQARLLFNKKGLKGKAKEEIITWLTRSAELGYTYAQSWLGEIHCRGTGGDPEVGLRHLEAAIIEDDARAKYVMATLLACGKLVDVDIPKAIQLCTEAAEANESSAQMMLGRCYIDGFGVGQNLEQATFWLEKSASQGDRDGIKALRKLKWKQRLAFLNLPIRELIQRR